MHLCILWVFTRNIILYRELLFHWNYSSSEPWLAGLLDTIRSSTVTAPLSWSWLKAGHCLSLVHTEFILLLLFSRYTPPSTGYFLSSEERQLNFRGKIVTKSSRTVEQRNYPDDGREMLFLLLK